MTPPRVSVIVPLYNKEAWVRRALDSIATQTLSDIEVIVVDDGSTDSGAAIVSAYPDPRFRLIRQPNAGPGAARNRGLEDCRAGLVAFLDADDEWLPGYLENAVAALDRSGAAAVSCSFLLGDGRSSEPMWRKRGLTSGPHRTTPATDLAVFVHALAFMSPCATLARLETVRRWGGFFFQDKCRYAEDAFLWLKFLLNETVFFDLHPRIRVHTDAGALSQNYAAARPLEPFLSDPQPIEQACPPDLRPLLHRFLAWRAFKTACVFGYWGHWREAARLRARFRIPGDRRIPYYWRSLILSTPLAAAARLLHHR